MAYNQKRAQEAEDNRENLRQQLTEKAIHSIRQYTKDPEDVLELANFMANFHQYSMKNQLLIQSQFEGASAVAGFKQFQKLGYHVRKGEKAIKIFSPIKTQYIVPEDGSPWIPQKKWSKEQRRQVRDNELTTQTRISWKMSSVFDISQTDMPKEEAPKLLPNRFHTFDMSHVEDESKLYQSLVNVAKANGISVKVSPIQGSVKGYAGKNTEGNIQIVLNNQLDQTNRIPTLIHEMTHAFLHFDENNDLKRITKEQAEFQAEFSSYMTCQAFNIDTSEKAIPYIANWTNQLNVFDDEELVNFLEETEKVSRNIIRLANNEWDRLTEQEKEEKAFDQSQQEENQKNSQSLREREKATSSLDTVLLAGPTTLEMIEKAKRESSSHLSFKINGHEYLLSTERQTGDSRLIDRGEGIIHRDTPRKIVGKEKYSLLQQIEDAGYLPMSVSDYQKMDISKEKHLYPSQQTYQFLKEASSQDRDKFNRLNQDYDPSTGILNQPFISIDWSEYDNLKTGQILTLEEATKLFNRLNKECSDEGYSKTKINLHLTPNEYYDVKVYSGKKEEDFQTQLKADYPRQMEEIELAQLVKETNELSYDDPEEWETLTVKTTFKGHQFQYDIQINRVDHDIKGTYTRDNEAPQTATSKSCLNALQYMIDNHELDSESKHLIQKAIDESQHSQQRVELYKENQERIQQVEEKEEEKQDISSMSFDEKIKVARQTNILAVAEAYGLHLIKDSRDQYRDADNHSMVFTPSKNTFYENNGNFGGDPITFAQKIMGIESFKEAVNYLVTGDYDQVEVLNQPKEPFQYDSSKESKQFDRARQYLVNERCIHPDLVDALHEKGYIRQDKRNNVLFLWNEQGRIVGCAEQGTVKMEKQINGRDHWKAIQKNSESYNGYAFNFRNGEPKHLKFFESDIDALSYASIHGLEKDTQYIAMDGLKDHIVAHYAQNAMEKTNNQVESIQLCVDRDEAGKAFAEKFDYLKQEGNPVKVEYNAPQIPNDLQNQVDKWDWNNECQYRHYQQQPSIFQTLENSGIQPSLLSFLKNGQFVTEDWKHQLTFNWNEDSKKVEETHCDSQFQITERAKGNQGFNIQNGQPNTLKCFDNPIELISYLSLHSLEENTTYVSVDQPAQQEEVMEYYIEKYPALRQIEVWTSNQVEPEVKQLQLKHSTTPISIHTNDSALLSQCQKQLEQYEEVNTPILKTGDDLEL